MGAHLTAFMISFPRIGDELNRALSKEMITLLGAHSPREILVLTHTNASPLALLTTSLALAADARIDPYTDRKSMCSEAMMMIASII